MKILHVIPTFHPAYSYGGTVTVSYQLTTHLALRGHEITVYTSDCFDKCSRQANKFLNVNGINIYYFKNISNSLAWNRFIIAPEMFLRLRTDIKNYDLIHLHEFRTLGNLFALYYAKKNSVPIIIEPQGSISKNEHRKNIKILYDIVSKYLLKNNCYTVIAATDIEASEAEEADIPKEKIVQILPGYDIQYFSDLPEPGRLKKKMNLENKKIILFLGRVNFIKGIDFLINAFAELTKQRNDTVLLIAGPDEGVKSSLESLINIHNLSNKVIFLGFLSGIDKLSAYVDADIFVQTSKHERFYVTLP
jgi:glycosyltransferase involved in cell wall biosynthesis